MSRLIKSLLAHRKVVFDSGSFDDWCVYVVEANGARKAPYDTTYFLDLKSIATNYEKDKVYTDFIKIYTKTTKTIDTAVVVEIDAIVQTYDASDKALIEQCFTVIYGGMIAEENKKFAILKKRIKRLGIHQILQLDYEPKIAANFSKGKTWRALDVRMKSLGF